MVVNSLTLFLVFITFVRTVWGLGGNVTTIESWEIERHRQLLRRARVLGGYLDGPDGIKIKMVRQEFPYDVGIWQNIGQGMGTSNPLGWFWPFASTVQSNGLEFPVNGFEDPGTVWPPPDPDRMPRIQRTAASSEAFTFHRQNLTPEEELDAFRRRQEEDLYRRSMLHTVSRRRPFHERYSKGVIDDVDRDAVADVPSAGSGEEAWQDSGGNRLQDYGVDEDIEFYDEDNIPLAELMRRKEQRQRQVGT